MLEKGESILDKPKQEGLYRIVEFTSALSEQLAKTTELNRFGSALNFNTMWNSLMESQTKTPNLSPIVHNDITVKIDHSGEFNDAEAEHYGKIVADTALTALSKVFNLRGVGAVTPLALKNSPSMFSAYYVYKK